MNAGADFINNKFAGADQSKIDEKAQASQQSRPQENRGPLENTWYIQQQQNELNTIRERYLNMSNQQVEAMTPADMLNVTYEFNKKQNDFMHSMSKIKGMYMDDDEGTSSEGRAPKINQFKHLKMGCSSSSSSFHNEAGFNIFEEI